MKVKTTPSPAMALFITVLDPPDFPKQSSGPRERKPRSMSKATSIEKVASSIFVIGSCTGPERNLSARNSREIGKTNLNLLGMSSHATVGRNSQFFSLLPEDREQLGGIEYRALKLLLKICIGSFPFVFTRVQAYICRLCLRSSSLWRDLPCWLDSVCTS